MYNNNSNRSRAEPARGFMAPFAMLLAYSVLGAVVPSTPVHAQSFSGLGFLPGPGGNFSEAFGVNAGGTVVAGFGSYARGFEAFRWTQAGGMAGLGFLTGGAFSQAFGVNADGTVVVGGSTATGGALEAFRWTQAGGMAGLGFLPGRNFSQAQAVNADGTVVAGFGYTFPGGASEAFRWTHAGGMAGLGFLTGGTTSDASAVNADGTVVVGFSNATGTGGAFDFEAFRWTQAGGMAGLGFLPGVLTSNALGVNADGTVVVGAGLNSTSVPNDTVAFRWTQAGGMQSVQALLTAKGVSTTGWTLMSAQGVSADGQVIVGFGTDPSGKTQGWIARLAVPFLAFSAKLEIDLDRAPNEDRFELNSSFTLSSTASTDPLTEAVTLQIGTFTTTIPAGSFKKNRDGSFTFEGVIHGVSLEAVIERTGTLRYAFEAEARDANLAGTANPVPMLLTVGDDSGTTSVRAQISH